MSDVLWVAGAAVAVLALTQVARHAVRLREDLDELRARVPEPVRDARPRAEVQPLFGQLYEDKPSPLDGISSWPGVPLALAAAGLFAIGLVTYRPGRTEPGATDSTIAKDIAAARMQYDSLAKEVDALQDSMTSLRKPPAAVARVTERKVAPRSVAQKSSEAPLPSLPKVGP